MPSDVTHYEVQPGHRLLLRGQFHDPGSVLPEWYVNEDKGLAGRVSVGALAPTGRPTNVQLMKRTPKTADDPGPAMVGELNRVTAENAQYARSNAELDATVKDQAKRIEYLTKELGRMTEENAHLRGACDDHQGKIERLEKDNAELTAQLESATAPKPEPKKPKASAAA